MAMWKKAAIVAISILMVLSVCGCLGGGSTPPTPREEASALNNATALYYHAEGQYSSQNYSGARQEFVDAAAQFHDCQSQFTAIAGGNVTALEKQIATNLAGASGQYASAAQYMRDACSEATKPGNNNALLYKSYADDYETSARDAVQANEQNLAYLGND